MKFSFPLILLLLLVILGGGALLGILQLYVFRAAPAEVLTVQSPEQAARGDAITIHARIDTRVDDTCLGSTVYFFEYADGSLGKAPGTRSASSGNPSRVTYTTHVPIEAHLGAGHIWARDYYGCLPPNSHGAVYVETPQMPLEILP